MTKTQNSRNHFYSSELLKYITIPAIRNTCILAFCACVALVAVSVPQVRDAMLVHSSILAPGVEPETVGLEAAGLGLIAPVILGVLAAGQEYSNAQLKISLTAVPRRWRLFTAKCITLTMLTFVLAAVTIPATSVIAQYLLGSLSVIKTGIPASLILRWVGASCLWIATALISFALTIMMKQTVLPLFIMIITSQLTLVLIHLIPIAKYLPFSAGVQLYDPLSITAETPGAAMSMPVAVITLALWVIVSLGIAAYLFHRRDIQA